MVASALVIAHLGTAPRPARADEPPRAPAPDRVAFRVQSSPHAGCPGSDDIEASVLARTAKARAAGEGDAAWVFDIEFENEGGVITGRMTAVRDGQRTGERTVRGRSCADVATALALTVALSIDPRAKLLPDTAPSASPAPVSRPQGEGGAAPAPAPAQASATPAAKPPAHAQVRLGGAAGLAQVVSGSVMPAVSVGGETVLPWAGLLSPSVRVSVSLASNTFAPARDATFTWLSGQVDLCPFRAQVASVVELRPCAAFQGGVLRGRGLTAPQPIEATRAWWSAGVSGRIVALISPRAGIELSGVVVVPFRERDFIFENPARTIAHTTTPSWTSSLGAFVTFP
jgi:hypothetical protein